MYENNKSIYFVTSNDSDWFFSFFIYCQISVMPRADFGSAFFHKFLPIYTYSYISISSVWVTLNQG